MFKEDPAKMTPEQRPEAVKETVVCIKAIMRVDSTLWVKIQTTYCSYLQPILKYLVAISSILFDKIKT